MSVVVENRSSKPVVLLSYWTYLLPGAELRVDPRLVPGERRATEWFGPGGGNGIVYLVGASRDTRVLTPPPHGLETRRIEECLDVTFSLFEPQAIRKLEEPVEFIVEVDGRVTCRGASFRTYKAKSP